MVTTDTGRRNEDFYNRLAGLLNANQIDDAVNMIMKIKFRSDKLEVLSRLAHINTGMLTLELGSALELARTLDISPHLDVAPARINALVLACDLARAIDRNLDLSHDLNFDQDRNLTGVIDRAKVLNHVILRILEDDLLKNKEYRHAVSAVSVKSDGQIVFEGLESLTPQNLSTVVAPYLQAVFDVDKVIADLGNKPFVEPKIQSISLNSPLNIQLPGVGEAINALRDIIVPWRRKNARKLADLNEAKAEAEILELRSKTAQGRVETKIKEEEIEQKKLETEKLRLELEEKRLDIEKRKVEIELAISVIDRFAPEMLDRERITYVTRLLQPLNILIESPLELSE